MEDFPLQMASGGAVPAQRPKWPILMKKTPPGAAARPRWQKGQFWPKKMASGGGGPARRPKRTIVA